jgi:hypothetical protein
VRLLFGGTYAEELYAFALGEEILIELMLSYFSSTILSKYGDAKLWACVQAAGPGTLHNWSFRTLYQLRPHLLEHTGSRSISKVKLGRAPSVL